MRDIRNVSGGLDSGYCLQRWLGALSRGTAAVSGCVAVLCGRESALTLQAGRCDRAVHPGPAEGGCREAEHRSWWILRVWADLAGATWRHVGARQSNILHREVTALFADRTV